jgi:F0F1-type ATP synthase delta subunit
MKPTPQIYAQTLISSVNEKNLKTLAQSFWYKLQKNKQYRDLSKILSELDEQSAKNNGKILAKIDTKKELTETELQTLKEKLEKKYNMPVILKNIIGKNITGMIIKVDNQILDLSLENKVNRLKKILND